VTTAVLVDYIDQHREEFGVEPTCTVLRQAGMPIAPSSYYAAKTRVPSARAVADEQRLQVLRRVHADNYGVYGVRKMHAELNRRGHRIARCTVHRLMRAPGATWDQQGEGASHDRTGQRPGHPAGPAGPLLPSARTEPGVGRRHHLLPHLRRVGLRRVRHRRLLPPRGRLAAVEEPAHRPGTGRPRDGVVDSGERRSGHHRRIAHSDKGVQYLAVRYTQRLAEAGAVASAGSTGDSYDNAWPRRSTRCSRPSSSATKGHGRASTTSS
jgi:putative transposase